MMYPDSSDWELFYQQYVTEPEARTNAALVRRLDPIVRLRLVSPQGKVLEEDKCRWDT